MAFLSKFILYFAAIFGGYIFLTDTKADPFGVAVYTIVIIVILHDFFFADTVIEFVDDKEDK